MISAKKMKKYFDKKYSDRNTAKMITKEIKINIEYGVVDPTFVGKWYKGLSEGTIRILMKKGYIIRVGEDRHEGELGVLFRDVNEDNYIGRLYTLPDEKSVSKDGENE